jgi:hypothetical protein
MRQRKLRRPPLRMARILSWLEAEFRRSGNWPTAESGPIPDAPGETWSGVDRALREGYRGLEGGFSLARLLAATGRTHIRKDRPRLTEPLIAGWIEEQFRRTQLWPHRHSGPVLAAPGESWKALDHALAAGTRGLPGGTTLARLVRKHRNFLLQTTYVPIRAVWTRRSAAEQTVDDILESLTPAQRRELLQRLGAESKSTGKQKRRGRQLPERSVSSKTAKSSSNRRSKK